MLAMFAGGVLAAGETAGGPRVEEMGFGNIHVTMTADEPKVYLDRELQLTIKIVSPSEMEVSIPSLNDRLQGFIVKASINDEPSTSGGKTTHEYRYLLTPLISEEYRIAPIPVSYTDKSKSPSVSGWFTTRPLLFELVPPVDGKPGDKVSATLTPVWIYPSFKMVVTWIVLAVIAIVLAFLLWKLSKRVTKQIRLMRMSPKERALTELSELLAKDLIGKHLVKDFYIELTMIVRRYIERQHRIRAPEQTTQEFMEAVSHDKRFDREAIAKLKDFLEAADLVKFAAYQPDQKNVTDAVDTARDYVVTDADKKEQEMQQSGAKN